MKPLTIDDRDNCCAAFVIALKVAERWLQLIELSFIHEVQASDEYKTLRKLYGKAQADTLTAVHTKRILRNDDRYQIKNLLRIGADFHRAMDRIFDGAIEHGAYNMEQNIDFLQRDTNMMAYVQALMMNVNDKESDLQLLSTLKVLAKGDTVSDRILERIKKTVTI